MGMNDYAADREETRGGTPAAPVIKDSGDRTKFDTGAVRDMHEGKGRCDLLPMCVLLRLARHYEKGALKYQERNWEKGIPAHSFADSAMRHMFKYMDGQTDEDHLIAAIWNLCGLAWTEEKRPEMMDIPSRTESTTAETGEKSWFTEMVDGSVATVEDLNAAIETLCGLKRCKNCLYSMNVSDADHVRRDDMLLCCGQKGTPAVKPDDTCEYWRSKR